MEQIKQEFTNKLIEAIKEKSVEKLSSICVDYNSLKLIMGEKPDMPKEKYKKIVLKNCQTFFDLMQSNNINEYSVESINLYNDTELLQDSDLEFIDAYMLNMSNVGTNSRLSIEIESPVKLGNRLLINNPLLINYKEYEEIVSPVLDREQYIIQTSTSEIELPRCSTEKLKTYMDDANASMEPYLYEYDWYIHEGDLELDTFTIVRDTIITGDLIVKAPLVEPDCRLIVLGKTSVNAIALWDVNDIYLLGGVAFNVALLSMMAGPEKILRNLEGPFVYTDSDSTEIEGVEGIKCYADYVYGESHGDILAMLKEKYIDRDEPYDGEEVDEDDYHIDASLIVEDIRLGENIFNDNSDVAHFVEVKMPDLDSKESLIVLLKEDGLQFKKLDEKYRADKELISIAIESDEVAFKYITDVLKNDRDYVFSMIKENGRLLEYANKTFKKDREIVLSAIDDVAYALDYAHSSLKKDKEVVFHAIKKNPSTLEYADESLQADNEILLHVIEHDVRSFKYASESVIGDEDIILALVKKDPQYLGIEPLYRYKKDKAFILKVIEDTPRAFNYLSKKMQKDEDILAAYTKGKDE